MTLSRTAKIVSAPIHADGIARAKATPKLKPSGYFDKFAEEAKNVAADALQSHHEKYSRFANRDHTTISWGEIRSIVAEAGDGEYELQDVPRPEQPKLAEFERTALRSLLDLTMSEISEDHTSAGWHTGNEIVIWQAVQRLPGTTQYCFGTIDIKLLEIVRYASERLGEWFDGDEFIPLEKWREIVEE